MNIVFNFILICVFCFHYEKSSAENILNEDAAETTVELPLDIVDSVGTQLTRRSRQFFFQPSYVVVQNLQFPISANCIDNHGHPGLCREIGTCQGSQRTPPQLYYLPSAATKQAALAGPSRPNSTFIDTSIDNALPDADTDTDTETINSSKTATTTTPVMSHETEYNMQHVDDINSQWLYSGVRQWPFGPTQFGLQWPPPIPTHPASIGRWPPPIPTHPPNHQYPTHPPSRPAPITTQRTSTTTTTTTTTRRPIAAYPAYPGYPFPTYRPPIAITTTIRPITTSSTTTVSNDVSDTGLDANGLPLKCGIKNPVSPDQERIVGGNNASPHEFPWIAVLFKSGKQFCGGSLITQNHILSAAHCVARMTPWDVAALTAHLGDYNIRTDFEVKHVSRRIKRLVRHKGFDFSTLHNDISILTLSEPVKFSYEIQPICLPTSHAEITRSYSGFTATVVGWGSLRENGPQPSILQKVDIPVWSNSECQRKYGGAAPAGIISSMLCAGQAAKDSCSGDSGGPLIINDGGRYTQVGIVSWGIGCGKGQYPGVYTRVT